MFRFVSHYSGHPSRSSWWYIPSDWCFLFRVYSAFRLKPFREAALTAGWNRLKPASIEIEHHTQGYSDSLAGEFASWRKMRRSHWTSCFGWSRNDSYRLPQVETWGYSVLNLFTAHEIDRIIPKAMLPENLHLKEDELIASHFLFWLKPEYYFALNPWLKSGVIPF
jgi:hypothetical protein